MSQNTQETYPPAEAASQEIILDGWCKIGSTVYSDFYNAESDRPRVVARVHIYANGQGTVWTDKGPGVRELISVDFKTWIHKDPPAKLTK